MDVKTQASVSVIFKHYKRQQQNDHNGSLDSNDDG